LEVGGENRGAGIAHKKSNYLPRFSLKIKYSPGTISTSEVGMGQVSVNYAKEMRNLFFTSLFNALSHVLFGIRSKNITSYP
jgi:hypothetical protein